MNDFKIINVEYPYLIEKIYHLSDIHIRLGTRHQEYREVFNKFYDLLLAEPKKKNSIVIITGDILHSKTELNPECVKITRDFFQSILNIMNVIIIAGNHDANLANSNRLDSLTPLVDRITQPDLDEEVIGDLGDLNYTRYLYYLKESGVYRFNNIYFSLASVFDYSLIDVSMIHQKLAREESSDEYLELESGNRKLIALYHGSFKEAVTDTGAKMEDCSKVKLARLKEFDYALLGDIHRHQFLNDKGTIAYAGSMIQQNHSERIAGHGVLVWNFSSGEKRLVELPNQYGFLTLYLRGGKIVSSSSKRIPKKIYLRIIKEDVISNQEFQELLKRFQEENQVEILRCQDYSSSGIGSGEKSSNGQDSGESNNNEQTIKINLTNVKEQNQLIVDYLKTNKKKAVSLTIETGEKTKSGKPILKNVWNDKLFEEICKYNHENNLEIDNQNNESLNISNCRWKLRKLEFSNLFSYGENNQINFTKVGGIVGIVGPNHIGKSSILDIILYALYDKISRKGSIKEIINNQKDNFDLKLEMEMGGKLFGIRKHGKKDKGKNVKTKAGFKIPVKITFWKTDLDGNNREALTGETPQETKKIIEKYFGTFDDMILTNISLQNNNTRFADSTNTDRKKELEKLIKIEIFEKLKEISGKKHLEKQSVIKFLEKDNPNDKNTQYLKELLTFQEDLEISENKLQGVTKLIEDKMGEISKTQLQYNPSIKSVSQSEFKELLSEKKELDNCFGNCQEIEKSELEKMIAKVEEKHNQWQEEQMEGIETLEKEIEEKLNSRYTFDLETFNNLKAKIEKLVSKRDKIEKELESLELIEEKNSKLISKKERLEERVSELEKLLSGNLILDNIFEWIFFRFQELFGISNENGNSNNNLIGDGNWDKISSLIEEKITQLKSLKRKSKKQKEAIARGSYLLEDISYWFSKLEGGSGGGNGNENGNEIGEKKLNKGEIEIEIAEMVAQIGDFQKKINGYQTKLESKVTLKVDYSVSDTEISQKRKQRKEMIEIKKKNQVLDTEIKELKTLKKAIEGKKDNDYKDFKRWIDVSGIVKEFNQNYIIVEKLTKLEKELSELRKLEKELQIEEKRASEAISSIEVDLERTKDKIEELNQRKDSIEVDKLYLDSVKNLPFKLIEEICPKLEEKVNQILVSLVDFTLAFVVEGNDFNVHLKRGNFMIPLSNSSGFEKFISSLMIRVALIMISNLPKPNFLAIDEGWSNFDSENINNVGLIFEYLKTQFDFVLIISHIQPLRSHLNMFLDIKKKDGFSCIDNN